MATARNFNIRGGSGIKIEVDDSGAEPVLVISVAYTPGADPDPVGAAGTFTVDATNDLKISDGTAYVVVGTQT